ncbi:MAG TPA: hypothetical protein VMS65_04720 [Polyangiaceae bacterium]|nr:hypothetical protein [Polyangiaceae bacterium]
MRLAAAFERFPRLVGAIAAAFAALPSLIVFRGFTVDDALVSARVASHLADGVGYRFNPTGPEVDAVTPLGWAHLLAAAGPGTPLAMLERGRLLGALGWLAAVATLGALLARSGALGRRTALLLLALCAPAAAWATSGMETGFVTAFSTLALAAGPGGALAGGVAAALRPELAPYACVLAAGDALLVQDEPRRRAGRVALALALSLGPALAVALVRSAWFGTPAPLALSAKPPDLLPGLGYALVAALGIPLVVVLVAPLALRRGGPKLWRLTLAVAAHFAAVALAGGDWMPLFRLMIPVVPALLLAVAELAATASRRFYLARVAVAVAMSLWVAILGAWPARGVLADRLELIEHLRLPLRDARVTATVDAGLVGASTEQALLDLAGVTDPTVARLSGGHTSKRVPEGLLESRGVDHAVFELAPGTRVADPWPDSRFVHAVSARLAGTPFLERFELVAELPLGRSRRYVVVRKSERYPPLHPQN